MDLGIVIAIVGTGIAFIGSMITMMLWVRSEANGDRRESRELIVAIEADIKSFQERMHSLEKDFHGRLCKIEEERSLKILSYLANKN